MFTYPHLDKRGKEVGRIETAGLHCLDEASKHRKVLYCFYKVFLNDTRESKMSQPCLHTLIQRLRIDQ